jgi:glycine/D-amino acid oxidase-like deaminating enzyme
MDIAIIGAGFCGLAVAWHLVNHVPAFPHLNIHVFDHQEIGHGTSGIAAGLLHPFVGAHAKLNFRGLEGIQATHKLLQVAAQTLNRPVTSPHKGILRLAMTEDQSDDFRLSAERYPQEVQWLGAQACQELAPGCGFAPGLWIKEGLSVYSSLYLQGLWQACAQQGVKFEKRRIQSLEELHDFDITIVTAGAESQRLPECRDLKLKSVKGQLLEFSWPEGVPPLSCALNSHAYLLMGPTNRTCLVGATYEKEYSDAEVDVEFAKQDILPKAYQLFPPLQEATLLNCYVGIRAVTPQHLPFIKRLTDSQWVLTGMGSKGLLYHALFAQELVHQLWKAIH